MKTDIGMRIAASAIQIGSVENALGACKPPVVLRSFVALRKPYLLAVPGDVANGHRESTENREVELFW